MTKATTEDLPGMSVFFKDDTGAIFHTYPAYARGDERGLGIYMFLDLTPKGRDENGPNHNLMDWVRRFAPRVARSNPAATMSAQCRSSPKLPLPYSWREDATNLASDRGNCVCWST